MRHRLLKRFLALTLLVISLLSLVSCSHSPYDYDLGEYIKLGDYVRISVTADSAAKLMEEYKQTLLNTHATLSPPITNRPLKMGDIAVINYKCYTEESMVMPIGDNPIPSVMENTECHVILGRGKYPVQIENAILSSGVSGTPIEVRITLPSDYGISSLAGKNVIYIITVTTAYELQFPEFNDSFVAEHTPYSTVKEYELATTEQAYYDLIWNELIETTEVISYPYDELNEHTLDFIEYYTNLATSEESTLEAYLKNNFFIDLATFHIKADEFAKAYTKEEMMVYRLARSNQIEVSDTEYAKRAEKYVTSHKYSSLSELERDFPPSFIKYSILKDKVKEFVAANSFTVWE